MSNFICEHCGAKIIDSRCGYITGCEHYPTEITKEDAKRYRKALEDICRHMKVSAPLCYQHSAVYNIAKRAVEYGDREKALDELVRMGQEMGEYG